MPMKDAVTCEKLRVVGSKRRSGDLRMGEPGQDQPWSLTAEYIGCVEGTEGTETSQYLEEKKRFPE
jgi:hypothetical protein